MSDETVQLGLIKPADTLDSSKEQIKLFLVKRMLCNKISYKDFLTVFQSLVQVSLRLNIMGKVIQPDLSVLP